MILPEREGGERGGERGAGPPLRQLLEAKTAAESRTDLPERKPCRRVGVGSVSVSRPTE